MSLCLAFSGVSLHSPAPITSLLCLQSRVNIGNSTVGNDHPLSGGAIAGIVVGTIIAAFACLVPGVLVLRSRLRSGRSGRAKTSVSNVKGPVEEEETMSDMESDSDGSVRRGLVGVARTSARRQQRKGVIPPRLFGCATSCVYCFGE